MSTADRPRSRGTSEKAKGGTTKPDSTAVGGPNGEPGAEGNIDQIRDIIFGAQMKAYDQRFAQLEERLLKDSAELREDLRKRLSTLDQYVKKELESMSTELRSEQRARAASLKEIAGDIAELAQGSEQKLAALLEHMAKEHRDLRNKAMEQNKAVSDELQRKAAEWSATLNRESTEIRQAKVDRTALAAFFNELALRIAEGLKRTDHAGGK